ncbi:MAG: hypothetical protein JXR51_00105 [Bacteroidales bacterium]|nr:hypothetical protein [Bacteroidales bacterium]MBN2755542.1 hypothetical protein [Bacteroidales bacterium]
MIDKILTKIAVQPPYFALKDLSIEKEGVIKAKIHKEQQKNNEICVIPAAEVGRHLAILGSCSISLKMPDNLKYYYLAINADVTRISCKNDDSELYGTAETIYINKRNGYVETNLYNSFGVHLYNVVIKYYFMQNVMFEKIFDKYKSAKILKHFGNPYLNEIKLQDYVIKNNKLEATLGPLEPYQCSGHFPNYEAIPIAILMHQMSLAAGKLFAHIYGDENLKYLVLDGKIKADNLAFAGDTVKIIIYYLENSYQNFNCLALSINGKEYGSMRLALKPITQELNLEKYNPNYKIDFNN